MDARNKAIVILWRKYASYVLLPLLLVFLLVFYLTTLLRNQVLEQNALTARQAIETLDSRFDYTSLLAYKVMNDAQIRTLCRTDAGEAPYFGKLRQAYQRMQEYGCMFSDMAMLLYSERNRACVSTANLCTDTRRFYGELFQFGDLDYAEFLSALHAMDGKDFFFPVESVRLERQTFSGLVYGFRFPLARDTSYLFFVLDEDYLDRLFMVPAENGTAVYLLDANGGRLYSTGGRPLPEGVFGGGEPDLERLRKDNIVLLERSSFGLQYLCVTPMSSATRAIAGITALLGFLLAAAFMLALLFTFLMAKKNARALEFIFRNRPDMDDISWRDIYQGIREVMHRYQSDNLRLMDSVHEGQLRLRNQFFGRLLRGDFQHAYDLEIYMRDAQINMKRERYAVLLFALDCGAAEPSYEDLRALAQRGRALLRLLREQRGEDGLVLFAGLGRAVVLTGGDAERARSLARQLLEELCPGEGISLTACVGADPVEVGMLPLLFQRCTVELNWETAHEDRLGLAFPLEDTGAVSPPEEKRAPGLQENGLFTAICAGDSRKALDHLEALFFQAAAAERVGGAARREFMGQMRNILRLAGAGIGLAFEDAEGLLEDAALGATLYRYLRATVRVFSGRHAQARSETAPLDSAAQFRHNVARLIDGNIADPELSLTSAARSFGFTASYFSMLFKEHMGQNFLAYVEQRRMELARERILGRRETIEETALACGYQNANTFRRIYKKTFGVTPSQTREAGRLFDPGPPGGEPGDTP